METELKRQFRSKQERRAIVEETLQPGASVSRVARAHNVNANQVFYWRKQYREGWFDKPADAFSALIPVRIAPEVGRNEPGDKPSSRQSRSNPAGVIEIAWGTIRVRIEGAADPGSIRAVMDSLGR
jgi:transposase